MIDLLRSHPTTLALGVIGWVTWSAFDDTPAKAKPVVSGELPVVGEQAVALRAQDAEVPQPRNPFPSLLLHHLFQRPDDPEGDGEGEDGEGAPEAEPEPQVIVERLPSFTLRLDAIVALGANGGHARINGHDVLVGEVIPNCDPGSPPVLVDLAGLSARVEHRGRLHDLHLDLLQRIELGGEVIEHTLDPVVTPDVEAPAASEEAPAPVEDGPAPIQVPGLPAIDLTQLLGGAADG